ncbi:MAG: type II secretion system protein, partial [Planctomycetes bacterium]|nr:type II secretion system protein [Planctomycetota bacterium]
MAGRTRGGFTIVELLIVTAMIILLLSILVVAVNRASRTSQVTNTRALMNSISQSLERFKEDVGYFPPVLGVDRELLDPPDPVALTPDEYRDQIQQWYSVTTLADYLIGYGDDQQDAYDGVGIRHPGRDTVWGATIYGAADGSLGARNAGTGPASAGKVYGPYLELKDERLLAGIDPNGNIVFPGEDPDFVTYPKIIVDYWGQPIRYYRQLYSVGAIKFRYRLRD